MIFDVAVDCASHSGAHLYKRSSKPRFAALLVVYSSIPPIYTKEGDRSNILFRTPELSLPKRVSYLDATRAWAVFVVHFDIFIWTYRKIVLKTI